MTYGHLAKQKGVELSTIISRIRVINLSVHHIVQLDAKLVEQCLKNSTSKDRFSTKQSKMFYKQ